MNSSPFIRHPRHLRRDRHRRAFTLIELLVSMSVLALLLALVVQMIDSAMALSANSTKQLDADSQARLVFDRMAVDFAQIVKRQDVDYYLHKNDTGTFPATNDQIAFYSETSGYYPSNTVAASTSNAALVGYCIDSKYRLQRLSKALVWNGVTNGTPPAMTFLPQATPAYLSLTLPYIWPLTFNSTTNPDMSASADADYQVIGEQVFRMEVCYLIRDTNYGVVELSDSPYILPLGTTTAPATSPYPYSGLRNVVAVVVTLAALDNSSRVLVSPDNLKAAVGALDNQCGMNDSTLYLKSYGILPGTAVVDTNLKTPARVWQGHIDNGDLVTAGLPKAAASRVRVYERFFYLGNAQ